MGDMSCTILARDRSDFPAIREEAARRLDEFNKVIGENGYRIINRNRPYDQEKNALAGGANVEPDVTAARRTRFIIFLILLIVPAINLSSMTQSRLRRRVAEIGVRRAFGCTRMELLGQILGENFIVTLLAGVLGLIISLLFAFLLGDTLFVQDWTTSLNPPVVDASILIHASTFGWALLFCFVLTNTKRVAQQPMAGDGVAGGERSDVVHHRLALLPHGYLSGAARLRHGALLSDRHGRTHRQESRLYTL